MKLLKANLEVLLDQTRQQQTRLKKALEQVRDQYDFCVIDNAPDINISTINALVASNDVIVPLEVDDNTTEGLAELAEQIEFTREDLNPALTFRGASLRSTTRGTKRTPRARPSWKRPGNTRYSARRSARPGR